ncbi:nucleotidyltransferase family protein [Reichenbachiella sp. MALMAid0571]|uniref:nucleotidyltransferase family protein n=1 Tax=Reichenbachiella sp. MALMAid0571 TaxID=3143939 RepID=UPI0032DFEB11
MIDPELAVLILAAGESKRLGKPKQLLPYQQSTLLEHSISCAKSVCDNTIVVLGANADRIKEKTNLSEDQIVINPNWKKGIGSSIAFGIQSIVKKFSSCKQVMILLTDQPKISNELLGKLLVSHQNGNSSITACDYGVTIGVPAVFDQSLFPSLAELKNDQGAKAIIKLHISQTSLINFPEGHIDIDTEGDLKFLG